MKFKSLKIKLGLIISMIMLIIFIIVLSYYNFILNERMINSSVQFLSNAGIKYESELLKEIESTKTRGDVLAIIFSKIINEGEINVDSDKLLRSILNNNPNLNRLSIVYIGDEVIPDSLSNKQLDFNQKMNFLTMERAKNGIVKNTNPQIDNLKFRLFKKNLANSSKSLVFEPVNQKGNIGYIPVFTPIFSGQKYLGYIEADISFNWLNKMIVANDNLQKDIERYVVSNSGNIIATNNKKFTIGDRIKMICPSCPISSSESYKNFIVNGSELVYCHPVLLSEQAGKWHVCFKTQQSVMFELLGYQFWKHFLIGLFLLILSIVLIIVFIDYFMRPFKMLINFAQKVAVGDFECEQGSMEITREDEFGQLQKAFRGISEALKETSEVSKAIASGDFSKIVKVKSDKDLLASSINQMNNFLKKKEEAEELRKKDEGKQKWFNKGISLISDVLKTNQDDTKQLAERIIKMLVEFIDISLGGIYIKEITDNEKTIYRLFAAYAYSEKTFLDKQFYSGESLVGSCASEKRMIYMSSIPKGYMRILSGLGESVPQSLLLIPLIYNDEVFGVLELASLKKITEHEREFLQKAAENIANTLSLTQISSQTTDLLEKSRLQSVELEKRDKEMLNTLDQLRELQKETAKNEAEIRAKITAMNNTLLVVEYTTDGILLEANQKFLNSMDYTLEEIKGLNVLDLLDEQEKKELINIINTVKQGNFYEAVLKRYTKQGQEKWLLATYTPVLDEAGVTSSILFFATDISRIIAKEMRLKEKIKQLESNPD
ncbi:MAG: GAF domain-containing protein [Bacteroidota bacterium]